MTDERTQGLSLVKPHGGALVERVLTSDEERELRLRAAALPAVALDADALLDLELIATGGASPVCGFMGQRDHRRVLDECRLAGGTFFPLPLVLPVPVGRLGVFPPACDVALRDRDGALCGVMRVSEAYVRDLREESRIVHGTDDPARSGAARLLTQPAGALAGEVAIVRPRDLRFETAREARLRLAQHGFYRVAAGLGARIPDAANAAYGHADALLVQSFTGPVALHPRFPVVVVRIPLRRRDAGAREALLEALALRNFGASHLLVGHAGLDLKLAHALLRFRQDLGLELVVPGALREVPEHDAWGALAGNER